MKEIKNRYGQIIYENEVSRDDKELSNLNLVDSDLEDLDLRGYNFKGSNLYASSFENSNLEGSSFERANICYAYFKNCNLKNCNFTGSRIAPCYFTGSNLQGFIYDTCEVPVIDNIHIKLYEAITKEGCTLDIYKCHKSENINCREGWIVHLAGDKGYELQKNLGSTAAAAAFIYFRSDPNMTSCPDFYADYESAMKDIKKMAFKENKKLFLKSNVKKLFESIRKYIF